MIETLIWINVWGVVLEGVKVEWSTDWQPSVGLALKS